jgi:hypothetical protein
MNNSDCNIDDSTMSQRPYKESFLGNLQILLKNFFLFNIKLDARLDTFKLVEPVLALLATSFQGG